jgi:hypothetical protein
MARRKASGDLHQQTRFTAGTITDDDQLSTEFGSHV